MANVLESSLKRENSFRFGMGVTSASKIQSDSAVSRPV
jgi:hypothetical protein